MQRHLRRLTSTLLTVVFASCAVAWVAIGGTAVASASARYRSGTVHAQLLDSSTRFASNGAAHGNMLTGSDVIAGFVAVMAVVAVLFLAVTFVRRRARVA